ncbi:MAG TPA: T9SS type A sorting domain-containing protein [Bacteroidia bacterium]|nr:T9SS type A sorting domain-containing protein [Bacteroidia bacterium]
MKKLIILAAISCSLFTETLSAQCTGLRYRDIMFDDTTVSNVTYGSNVTMSNAAITLRMDVWMPKADTVTNRPLIILAHGGNFLGGSKTGADVLQFCNDFADMGYVVASIDYRIGMTNFPFPGPDSTDATEAVMRAVHDAKAAVRYFKMNYAIGGNTYGIDTSNIFFMGVSAGGFMALQVAYLDDETEFPAWCDTTNQYGMHGGMEGLSGNPGYSSNVRAVINVAGALGDTAFIDAGDEPCMLFHGDADQTVPYGSDLITLVGVYPLLQVDGSHSIDARLTQLGITHCFETYEGQDHVPHVSNALYYDTTLVITRNFLVHFLCGDPLDCSYTTAIAIDEMPVIPSLISVYPNPAEETMSVNTSRLAGEGYTISLYNSLGALVSTQATDADGTTTINTENLAPGVYMMNVGNGEAMWTQKVIVK